MAYAEKRVSQAKGKKGKVTWRARYKRPDGTWGSEPGFPTKTTAENWGEEQEAAIRAGRWIDPELSRKHFGVWAKEFMKARQKRSRTNDKRWDLLNEYILPKWQHAPLISITWFDVDSWAQTLPCEDVTRGHAVSLMSTIMTAAVDAQHLLVNPLAGRRRSKEVLTLASAEAKREETAEKWHRPEDVILVAERLGPARGLMVLTAGVTGINWGEGQGLHRSKTLLIRREPYDGGVWTCPVLRIDQEVAESTLRDEDGKKLGDVLALEPVKTKYRIRDIDLPPFLALLWRYHYDDWPFDWMLSTANGKWWRRSNWGKVLRPAADGRPELDRCQGRSARPKWEPIAPGMTMRSLRHTADTYQEQIGVKAPLAYEQAGHKQPGIKGVYQHPTPEMRQERLDGLQEIFERAMRNLGLRTLWGRVDLRKGSPWR